MATAAQVEEFRAANQSLVALAQRDLTDFWGALQLSGDPVRVLNELLEFFPDLLQTYGDTAAVLGADWYDQLRDVPASAKSFQAVLSQPTSTDQAQGATRWALAPLFPSAEPVYDFDPRTGEERQVGTRTIEPDPDRALARLMGATQRLVLKPGRDSIWNSAGRDPVPTGVARVPSGTSTCAFCVMLASRGPVYQSQVSAELVVGRGSNRTGYDSSGKRLVGGIGGGVKARGSKQLGDKFHDNCVVGETWVSSVPDVETGYRRYYEGEIITLVTAAGHDLTITPNHPVLTDRGWVRAGMLNEGDYLLSSVSAERNVVSGPREDHAPSRIEDLVGALSVVGSAARLRVPGTAEQFHGDGFDSEVDVVSRDDLLRDELDVAFIQPVAELAFHGGSIPCPVHGAAGAGLRELELFGGGPGASTSGSVRGLGLLSAFFGRQLGGANFARIGRTSERDAVFGEPSVNDVSRHGVSGGEGVDAFAFGVSGHDVVGTGERPRKFDPPELESPVHTSLAYAQLGRDLADRLAGSVHRDRLVKKSVGQFAGHVFNLSTSEGWYSANSITVSNCDCVSVVIRSPRDYPAGYDPDSLFELYKQGVGIEPAHAH